MAVSYDSVQKAIKKLKKMYNVVEEGMPPKLGIYAGNIKIGTISFNGRVTPKSSSYKKVLQDIVNLAKKM